MTHVYTAGGLTLDWIRRAETASGPNVGGNAAYAAVGAHLARAQADVVAVLGSDYPSSLLEQLESAGIGTKRSRRAAGPSFRVLLDDTGDERQITYLPGSGTNRDLDPTPDQLPAGVLTGGLHICAIPTDSQRAILDAVRGRVDIVTLDTVHIPGEIEPTREGLISLASEVDVFLPSREEVDRFWPGGPVVALRILEAAGIRQAVVKLGRDGSVGLDHGELVRMPAAPSSVVDTTGAGDAYCGAFCAARSRGDCFAAAMAWGSAAASVVIEGYGLVHALSTESCERAQARYLELEAHTDVV